MSTTVTPDGIAGALQEILTDYCEDLAKVADATLHESAESCKADIQAHSPVGDGPKRGRYKSGWSIKKHGKLKGVAAVGGYVVHNKTDYQLTHLLEKGHVGKNQYGTWGRVDAHPHIGDAEKKAIEKCMNDLRSRL